MIYKILAIFNEAQLVEVETVLNQLALMPQGYKNQMLKAVEDYQYLVDSLQITRGLTKQIILFLLDDSSTTPEGIESFLSRLETWLVIVESKKEQRIYAEVVHKYRDMIYCFDDAEVLALRFSLIDILRELDEDRTAKKAKKQRDNWERDSSLTRCEVPMQLHSEYVGYELQMKEYGKPFESKFKDVSELKSRVSEEQPSFYDQFIENYSIPKGWVTPVLYQDN